MSFIDNDPESPEYVYDDMSPIRRYYCDVHSSYTKSVEIVMSFEDLLRSQGMIDDSTPLEPLRKSLFSIAETSATPAHARERYILLPLEIVAPFIDQTMKLDDQKAWYKDTISHIKPWLAPDHTELCIEQSQTDSLECINGDACPLIIAYKHLVDDICQFDPDDTAYILDPKKAYGFARMKMEVATMYGLMSVKAAAFHLREYDKLFAQSFSELPIAEFPQPQDD